MDQRSINQKEVAVRCEKAGCKISQATISNAISGKGNLTITNLLAIAYALEVEIADLVDVEKEIDKMSPFLHVTESELLITNPKSRFFRSYLGKFNILFYKTTGLGEELVTGTIDFSESEDGKRCKAYLEINAEVSEEKEIQRKKEYIGELILSQSMHAAYCYLVNSEAGEICMLVFRHWYSIQLPVASIMAAAITTASGTNRLPTVHRMCLVRTEMSEDIQDLIKGQLLMNTVEIFMSRKQLEEILYNKNIPESFRNSLKKAVRNESYFCICETDLNDLELREKEQAKWISYVRAHSKTPKYNKISQRTEEMLYEIIKDI